ncbi:hypothetical protein [Filifactor villosus]|uniref:Bacterial PH domain-containing protein n=1 Tax=Filifactor villosus TaxID=29374 RepID=A0ABV9QHI0_9FIRM
MKKRNKSGYIQGGKRNFVTKTGEKSFPVKIGGIIAGVFICWYSIREIYIIGMVLGVLLIMATFLKKTHIINEEGVIVEYDMGFSSYRDVWEWEEITSILWEASSLEGLTLYVGRGEFARIFRYRLKEKEGIVGLALHRNPKIRVGKFENS